jgi:hypothetical protein
MGHAIAVGVEKNVFLFLLIFCGMAIAQAQTVVETTKTLFHAGARQILEEDIQANTVPQIAWDQFIMGGNTAFDLPEYRRGLYGAESIHGTGLYATYNILAGREPWVMIIKVREDCVNQRGLFQSEYSVMSSAEKSRKGSFSEWYWAHKADLAAVAPVCLEPSTAEGLSSDWKEGAFYSVSDSTAESIQETKTCGPTLNKFLNEKQYKIIRDVVNDNSWYIRDRSCIQSIEGTPDQLFLAIAENKVGNPEDELFMNLLGDAVDPSQSSSGIAYIILKVLSETSYLKNAHLSQLKGLAKGSGYSSLDKVLRNAEALSLANNADSEDLVMLAYDAAARSVVAHSQKAFQEKLKSLLVELLQNTGAVCKGKHGIVKENRQACRAIADVQTQKIVKLLLLRNP